MQRGMAMCNIFEFHGTLCSVEQFMLPPFEWR